MKFITVVDLSKINEIIETQVLVNNCMFEIEGSTRGILVGKLSDLNVESDSIVNGFCLDGSDGDLSVLWSSYLKTLPVKTGDVIVQFSVNSDECIFCDFNSFMEFNYSEDVYGIEEIISYRFDKEKIAFTQSLELVDFEKAFIVSNEWSKQDLVETTSINSRTNLVTSLIELKHINKSNIWR